MEPASQHDEAGAALRRALENQLREMYGRVAYTHKTHEKMADEYVRTYGLVKRIEIALSAVATSSLLLAVFGDSHAATVLGAVLSTVLLALTLYFKEAALGEQSQKHSATASTLWGCRERLLSLLVDMHDGRDPEALREERDQINAELEEVYRRAPRTSDKAYRAAQDALKRDEELYFSDAELNRLLPKQLRK